MPNSTMLNYYECNGLIVIKSHSYYLKKNSFTDKLNYTRLYMLERFHVIKPNEKVHYLC